MNLLDIFERNSANYVPSDETLNLAQKPILKFAELWIGKFGSVRNAQESSDCREVLDSEILSLSKLNSPQRPIHTRIFLRPETGCEESQIAEHELVIRLCRDSELADVLYYENYDDTFTMDTHETLLLLTRWLAKHTYPSRQETIKAILSEVQKTLETSEASWRALEPQP